MREPSDHELRVLLIGKWLTRFASVYSLYGKPLKESRFELFLEVFTTTSPSDLQYAFERTLAEFKGPEFPSPAQVKSFIVARDKERDTLESEKAWDKVRWICSEFWQAELGIQPWCLTKVPERYADRVEARPFNEGYLIYPKPLDGKTDFAVRSVGGWVRIADAGGKDHDWIKKEFLRAHQYHSTSVGLIAPSREEAKKLLDGLKELGNG